MNKKTFILAALLPAVGVIGAPPPPAPIPTATVDLTQKPQGFVTGVGGTAIFANQWEQPTGTGVFDPFLTIERDASGGNPSGLEQGYNTDGAPLYNDQQRPHWNTLLRLGDLAEVDRGGTFYHCFILDANEPGANKSLISIDNVRIYTSTADNTASVGSNLNKLDQLGDLRWAMNDPAKLNGKLNDTQWVLLDADQEDVGIHPNANGGSGQSDMVLFVPVSAFARADEDDHVWFWNLNGVKVEANSDLGAQAGYEEWRACVDITSVPDGGLTIALLGLGLMGIGVAQRRLRR